MQKIEIPLSKLKLLFSIGGATLFVVLGFHLLTTIADRSRYDPNFIKALGIITIIFFGAAGIYGVIKLFDKGMGLIIDDIGIIDNTNASSVGLIKWSEITEIRVIKVKSTKILLIYTSDPNNFLRKVSGIKRKLMKGNMKMYGTPLSITSTAIRYDFNDLEKTLNDRLMTYRKMPNR
ncbi:MAG: hypothetical protein ITG00_07355 [Flavobacterium sp.]|nr:hypothetical protein [Flavobacterium sp.]